MTLEEYLKSIDYEVSMKLLGKMKNHQYYIQDDLPNDEDIGLPLVIEENIIKHTFKVCDSDQATALMKYF